jgi:lipopolysaccharide transport system ATP-binding protein
MEKEIKIRLQNVSKHYRLYNSEGARLIETLMPFLRKRSEVFTALSDVNLEVSSGEIVGVIGRNGSGKSTLLRIAAGISQPSSGSRIVNGTVIPMFELGTGFNRELTGRENLRYFSIMQNFDKTRAGDIIEKAIAFADIGRFIDQPLRTYSRGMRSRLAFSISVFLNAEILIIDEVLGVGDAAFKEKSQEKMRELITSGKTILMVTHSEKEVKNICTRAVLLKNGAIIMDGKPKEVLELYNLSHQNKPLKPVATSNKREK